MQTVIKEADCYRFMTQPYWGRSYRPKWLWKWMVKKEKKKVNGVCKTKDKRHCTHLWLIHVGVWQKTTKLCKAIILQLKNKLLFFFFLKTLYINTQVRKMRETLRSVTTKKSLRIQWLNITWYPGWGSEIERWY